MTQDHILRKDTRGRVVVTAERRAGLLAQFDQSGISGIQFAKLEGIKYTTFANWLQKRRRQRNKAIHDSKSAQGTRSRVRWLEAVVMARGKKSLQSLRQPRSSCMGREGCDWN